MGLREPNSSLQTTTKTSGRNSFQDDDIHIIIQRHQLRILAPNNATTIIKQTPEPTLDCCSSAVMFIFIIPW